MPNTHLASSLYWSERFDNDQRQEDRDADRKQDMLQAEDSFHPEQEIVDALPAGEMMEEVGEKPAQQ